VNGELGGKTAEWTILPKSNLTRVGSTSDQLGSACLPIHVSPNEDIGTWVVNIQGGSSMKRVEAFIKPFTADSVKDALQEAGVEWLRMIEAREFSTANRYAEVYAGTEYEVDERPRMWVLAFVDDAAVPKVIDVIREHAGTDTPLDGCVIVSTIDHIEGLDRRK